MHITLESDYAIRIVVFLAQQGKRADAKLISENTEVSLRFALKILRKLVSGGSSALIREPPAATSWPGNRRKFRWPM